MVSMVLHVVTWSWAETDTGERALHNAGTPGPRESALFSAISEARKQLNIHGRFIQETAYRVHDSGEFTKIRQQVLLTEQLPLTHDVQFHSTQRAYEDAVFGGTDNYPHHVRSDQEWDVELRETYVDYSHGALDVRLGKQQIVWGDTVGLFVADTVNAKDLREYILPDFDLIRIPQWAVDVEATQGQAHAEFVWLPVRDFDKLGVSGSEFEQPYPVPTGTTFTTTDPSRPPASFSNSEIGGRVSYLLNGLDVGAFYLYTWDKLPIFFRTISGSVYQFSPKYRRAHLFGATFSKDVHGIVFKGELLINPNSDLTTFDTKDSDGIVRRPVIDYVLGADYTWLNKIDTNVQLIQRVIGHHTDLMQDDTVRTHLSFWAKTDLLNGRLQPEFLLLAGVTEVDLMYRPKLTVKLTDALQWKVGADVFQGRPGGLFGRFEDRSRIYSELTYFF